MPPTMASPKAEMSAIVNWKNLGLLLFIFSLLAAANIFLPFNARSEIINPKVRIKPILVAILNRSKNNFHWL